MKNNLLNLFMDYADWQIYKVVGKEEYYVLKYEQNNLYSWREVEIIDYVEDTKIPLEELLNKKNGYDFCGEELNGTTFIYFKYKEIK